MQDFLARSFYGNTVSEWAMALAIAIGAVLVGKIVYWFAGGILRRATASTKTTLDDALLDTVDGPVVVVVTVLGFRVALQTLSLPADVDVFLANAIQAAVVVAITWMTVRLFDSLVRHALEPLADASDNDLDDQLLPIIRKGGRGAIWALGLIVALNNAGYDVAALIAGLGIGGLALAMAAQDTVKNVFGGFTIFTDQPFTLRDRIRVSGFDGSVQEIGVRSTRIKTLDGTEVTIPNSAIANSPVENVSREPSRKVVLNLGLTYDTSPDDMRRAMAVLREIHGAHADQLTGDPVVGFNGFGDFAMNVLFVYYIARGSDVVAAQTSINLAILDRFNAEGLDFAFPTQTIITESAHPAG